MSQHPREQVWEQWDRLPEAERDAALEHAQGCPMCRQRWIALAPGDASRLFQFLSVRPIPEFSLEQLSRRIELETARHPRPGRAEAQPEKHSWRAAMAIAASVLLAGFFGYYVSQSQLPVAPVAQHEPTAPEVRSAVLLSPETLQELVAASAAQPSPVARGIELLDDRAETDVVEFAVGDTQVVMIFDKGLEL